jgi:hypothetical protein
MGSRLGRPEVDADGAKRTRAGRLRCARKDLGLPRDRKVGETGGDDRRLKLCFQQSTGNSTGPEVYFLFRSLRHLPTDHDVADLQSPA